MAALPRPVVFLWSALTPVAALLLPVVFLSERTNTGGRVVAAGGVAKKRIFTDCRIVAAGSKTEERIIAFGSVIARIASVRRRINRPRCGRKRKRNENECADETDTSDDFIRRIHFVGSFCLVVYLRLTGLEERRDPEDKPPRQIRIFIFSRSPPHGEQESVSEAGRSPSGFALPVL